MDRAAKGHSLHLVQTAGYRSVVASMRRRLVTADGRRAACAPPVTDGRRFTSSDLTYSRPREGY